MKVIVKTKLKNPPSELIYCWGEGTYPVYPVKKDGTVVGLTPDHPRFAILKGEWKLEVVEEAGKQRLPLAGGQKSPRAGDTDAKEVK